MKELGVTYNINSDDIGYIVSGKRLLEEKILTMHGVVSAQIMPGLSILIAGFAALFGKGVWLFAALKMFWFLLGILIIVYTYKLIYLLTSNKTISALCCLFFLGADYIWINNLILTETPFILCFILLVYYAILLERNRQQKKYFYLLVTFYIISLMIRPNNALFPLFFLIFILLKKYDIKLLVKQGLIAGLILSCFIIPWSVRNYNLFDKFIPLTYGTGNPLLLGTYQCSFSPSDQLFNYDKVKNLTQELSILNNKIDKK